MTLEEARRDALIRFGGVEAVAKTYADRRSLPSVDTLILDVRYGARMLWKSRGLTAIVALTPSWLLSSPACFWFLRPWSCCWPA